MVSEFTQLNAWQHFCFLCKFKKCLVLAMFVLIVSAQEEGTMFCLKKTCFDDCMDDAGTRIGLKKSCVDQCYNEKLCPGFEEVEVADEDTWPVCVETSCYQDCVQYILANYEIPEGMTSCIHRCSDAEACH